ncbi:MAG: response regulator [bacterium]|nr:response regulator [bacterium]
MEKKILVVDDDNAVRVLINDILNKNGFNCDCAADGFLAIDYFEKKKYDLVLLDIFLPGKDGLDTMKEIKALYPDTMFIAVTGYARAQFRKVFLRQGFDDYISKPFNFDSLFEMLKLHLAA